jgi:hypothetical protein
MTIVVIRAARKTKAPNELKAIMELKFNFAPYEDDVVVVSASSFSTELGIFTSGD